MEYTRVIEWRVQYIIPDARRTRLHHTDSGHVKKLKHNRGKVYRMLNLYHDEVRLGHCSSIWVSQA